jgi:hypothetical protein
VLNDLTVGKYDVVMDTGPGYDTKRLEAQDAMLAPAQSLPGDRQGGGDLIIRQFDAPGMSALADRLAGRSLRRRWTSSFPRTWTRRCASWSLGLMTQLQQAKQMAEQLQKEKDAKVFGIQEREDAVTVRVMHQGRRGDRAPAHEAGRGRQARRGRQATPTLP